MACIFLLGTLSCMQAHTMPTNAHPRSPTGQTKCLDKFRSQFCPLVLYQVNTVAKLPRTPAHRVFKQVCPNHIPFLAFPLLRGDAFVLRIVLRGLPSAPSPGAPARGSRLRGPRRRWRSGVSATATPGRCGRWAGRWGAAGRGRAELDSVCSPSLSVQFTTTVVSCRPAELQTEGSKGQKEVLSGFQVVLEDTLLFPEGGGQVPDPTSPPSPSPGAPISPLPGSLSPTAAHLYVSSPA